VSTASLFDPDPQRLVRATGLQTAQCAIAWQLRAWRDQMETYEYAVLLDIGAHIFERERRRISVARGRHLELVR